MTELDYFGDLPTGSRLDTPERPANVVGSLGTHDLAEPERVTLARRHFLEANESDFQRVGRRLWVDRASGKQYRRVGSDPLADLSTASRQGLVFFVAYGRLVYLRPRGREHVESRELGSLSSGEVGRRTTQATSGPRIF